MIHITSKQSNKYVITAFIQIVSVFALCIGFLSFIGTLFQSLLEAQAAATIVFQLIDEVNCSQLRSQMDKNVYYTFTQNRLKLQV